MPVNVVRLGHPQYSCCSCRRQVCPVAPGVESDTVPDRSPVCRITFPFPQPHDDASGDPHRHALVLCYLGPLGLRRKAIPGGPQAGRLQGSLWHGCQQVVDSQGDPGQKDALGILQCEREIRFVLSWMPCISDNCNLLLTVIFAYLLCLLLARCRETRRIRLMFCCRLCRSNRTQ